MPPGDVFARMLSLPPISLLRNVNESTRLDTINTRPAVERECRPLKKLFLIFLFPYQNSKPRSEPFAFTEERESVVPILFESIEISPLQAYTSPVLSFVFEKIFPNLLLMIFNFF